MPTRIVNKYKERFDVYIGRGSKWGNVFVVEKDSKGKEIPGSREKVISQYKEWIMNRPDLLRLILIELVTC